MAEIKSGASSDLLTIDVTSKAARTTLYNPDGSQQAKQSGDVQAAGDELLPLSALNDAVHRPLRSDRFGSLSSAQNSVLFEEPFDGTAAPAHRWVNAQTYVPAYTAANGVNVNSTSLTTAVSAIGYSLRRIPLMQRGPLQFKARARIGQVANVVHEIGIGSTQSATASSTTGLYFQVTTGGVVQGVLSYNGVDVTVPLSMPMGWQANFYVWDILRDDDEIQFFVQETATSTIVASATIRLTNTQARMLDASRLSVFYRMQAVSVPASAPAFVISGVSVVLLDLLPNKPWGQIMAAIGHGGEKNPSTYAQTANFANSTAPASATLSNTAAGYTTLGGLFQFAAPAGAVTDFALFAFTVPAPYGFVCTGVDIDTINTGAAVATTATVLQWAIAADSSAVSLATAGLFRTAIGFQQFAVGAAIGAQAPRLTADFSQAPLVTNPGRLLHVIVRVPIGTATASQIIQGTVTLKGYFE